MYMSDIIYLKVIGQNQEDISEGCSSEKSVGNRWQSRHEDEIFVFSFQRAITSTVNGVNHQGIRFCKTIDKSSPLLKKAINDNEACTLDFTFYRINRWGRWERYYHIEVRGAHIREYWMHTNLAQIPQEIITVDYDCICSKHLIANTEYSELLTPENYNKLFPSAVATFSPVEKPPKKREITLTIGIFFDGTGNNLLNTNLRMAKCQPEHFGLNAHELSQFSQQCMKNAGFNGVEAGSYLNYYTNIKWLNDLYYEGLYVDEERDEYFKKIYIEGVGTENNKADSLLGMGLGNNDTGVIAKTDKAILEIRNVLNIVVKNFIGKNLIIKKIQFDVFGFSRGAAAARHFTNRIFDNDYTLYNIINIAFKDIGYKGKPTGEVRFLGIFDTVTAVGGVLDGFDPHDSNNLAVKIDLPAGVAKKVFHLTAMNECRYNFCLNSVKERWPELSLPGAHADIGGGYNPLEEEYLFLSRPEMQIVPAGVDVQTTEAYRKAAREAELLPTHSVISTLLPTGVVKIETEVDDSIPPDQYHNPQKRVAAAVTFRRNVSNDWSKVSLRVMYEVAKEAGVVFDHIRMKKFKLQYPEDLKYIAEKAVAQGKAIFADKYSPTFISSELEVISKYIHCSSHWNSVDYDNKYAISSGVSFSESLSFVNRPDENWVRTIYNFAGEEIK